MSLIKIFKNAEDGRDVAAELEALALLEIIQAMNESEESDDEIYESFELRGFL